MHQLSVEPYNMSTHRPVTLQHDSATTCHLTTQQRNNLSAHDTTTCQPLDQLTTASDSRGLFFLGPATFFTKHLLHNPHKLSTRRPTHDTPAQRQLQPVGLTQQLLAQTSRMLNSQKTNSQHSSIVHRELHPASPTPCGLLTPPLPIH
jgi:hypothetical protein